MNIGTIIQLATLISVVVGVIGLLITFRGYQRQVNAQFMLEYTRRVDDIMQTLPLRVWAPHLTPNEKPPAPSDELTLSVLRCLNYVSQLYFFCHMGYLPKSVWRLRQSIYVEILQTPLFMREWKHLRPIFATETGFSRFVERAQQGRVTDIDLECETEDQH